MDSSITALFISKYKTKTRVYGVEYPITIRTQGKDIVRTWLYYSLLRCYLLTGKIPFKHAWIGGLGLDAQGRAMRKSLGNFLDPEPLLQKFGADTFRFWGAGEANQGYDFRVSEDRIAGAGKFLSKLWNTARYISMFPQPKSAKLPPTDKWILNELAKLAKECVEAYGEFDLYTPATKIREFLWNVFAAHYIEMTKSRAYGDNVSGAEQEAAWFTLHELMKNVLLLLAPITPHITDSIWKSLYGKKSIHLELFPRVRNYRISERLSQSIIDFNTQVWKVKREKGLGLRDSIEVTIPRSLKPYENDIIRMHHITKN